MTLPRSARRSTIVVMRSSVPDPSNVDDWNRPTRSEAPGADPPELLRTTGDLQPLSAAEIAASHRAGTSISTHVAFLEVLDVRTGDLLRTLPLGTTIALEVPDDDDGLRYDVTAVDRPGRGRRLDHLEVTCRLVTAGVPSGEGGS